MVSITPKSPITLHVFELNDVKIEFPQKKAVLNFGNSIIETFGLINCIAIGGIFVDNSNEVKGAFMTHESPTDILNQMANIDSIIAKVKEKKYSLRNLILFKIEPLGASNSIYKFKSKPLKYDELCAEIANDLEKTLKIKPIIVEYGYYCGRYMKNRKNERLHLCGKAAIDPTKTYITTYSGNIHYGGKQTRRVRRKKYSESRRNAQIRTFSA